MYTAFDFNTKLDGIIEAQYNELNFPINWEHNIWYNNIDIYYAYWQHAQVKAPTSWLDDKGSPG